MFVDCCLCGRILRWIQGRKKRHTGDFYAKQHKLIAKNKNALHRAKKQGGKYKQKRQRG
nr:MAG TPA: hypothetical protein [Caudoviricetes sp.]